MREDERTIQEIFKLWFWNFQNPSLQQFTNLYHATIAILQFFTGTEKKFETEIIELNSLYFHPISNLQQKYSELTVSKNVVDWNISQLEWCYFRDTRRANKLGKEYYPDDHKRQEMKKITLGEMITSLSLFKLELFKIIIKILVETKFNIFIALPTGTMPLEQLRSDDFEKNSD